MKPTSRRKNNHKYTRAINRNNNNIKGKRKKAKGPGTKIFVIDNKFTDALKRFNRLIYVEGILKELKRRKFYLKPSDRKREKMKASQKRKRYELSLREKEEITNERKRYKTIKIHNDREC